MPGQNAIYNDEVDHHSEGGFQPRASRRNSPGIQQPQFPSSVRQTTGAFSTDFQAKQRATDRHDRRLRQQKASQQQHVEEPQQPGPVQVPGINGSSVVSQKSPDSKVKEEDDHSNLLTAIPVEDGDEELDELEKQRIEEKVKHDVRLKFVGGAVEAEITNVEAEEKERERKKCRRMMIYACLVFVLLVGGGAAIAIALSSSSTPEETESPTLAPTTLPTVRPPIFMGLPEPTENSTDTPPGMDASVAQPGNTVCEGAFDIATTVGISFFGTIAELATVAPVGTCEVIENNGVGVWYRILGDGSRYSASTCESTAMDTQISIFKGACGKLQCVAGNDQMRGCGNGDQSLVGFATEPAVNYYIYVHARRQSRGLFKLLVDTLNSNDECQGAVPLEFDGPSIFDSTRGAKIDNVECFGQVPDAPGVWYTLQIDGTGFSEVFSMSYETSDTAFSFPRTMIFTGDSCGSLTCVQNDSVGFLEAGVVYYILVYGRTEAVEGDYRISVRSGNSDNSSGGSALSQDCDVPVFLVPGASHDSNTESQSRPEFGSCGNQVFATAGGAWYDVIGTGGPLRVSTCNSTSGFDTQISVLQGPCENLTCVDGNDQACGDYSSVSWLSEADVTYHIAVHGYSRGEGGFTILFEEEDVVISGTCDSALSIDLDGVSVLGSTDDMVPLPVPICGVSPEAGPGVWYKVTGSGRSMVASTCLSSEGASTKITVFSGECNNLSCVEALESPCGTHQMATWIAEREVEYYVLVQSQSSTGSGAPFVFYAEETTTNDLCDNAIGFIEVGGSLTYGSTRSVTIDTLVSTTRGVWYTVLGTGTELVASSCSEFTDFSTTLSVYQSSDSCETLTPIETAESSGNCAFGSIQSWMSVEDEVYYVLVAGEVPDDFGNFALRFTSFQFSDS